jgi:phage baseplate assembly protein W
MAVVQRKDYFTPRRVQQEYFSDFLSGFGVDIVKKDLTRVVNEDAVKQSIRNLLLTNRGDRFFNNTVGSDLRGLLFENASPALEQVVSEYIRKTIENYEPRAEIIDIRVSTEADDNLIVVAVVFRIINKQEPIVLDLILNRIR